jgi:hypothetical protein
MRLKKCLRSRRSQAIVEYVLIFSIISLGVLVAFGGWSPERLGIASVMNRAVENALSQITR